MPKYKSGNGIASPNYPKHSRDARVFVPNIIYLFGVYEALRMTAHETHGQGSEQTSERTNGVSQEMHSNKILYAIINFFLGASFARFEIEEYIVRQRVRLAVYHVKVLCLSLSIYVFRKRCSV